VEFFHVLLEFVFGYPPNTATANFDRGETARTHEGVNLRDAHAEVDSNVHEREKPRFNP
jgi:hypothetical protein